MVYKIPLTIVLCTNTLAPSTNSRAQMETISLCIIAALLIGAGCASTVLSTYVFPLSVRVRGQAHGRFAGLSAVEQDSPSGSTRKVGGPGHGAVQRPALNLIVA